MSKNSTEKARLKKAPAKTQGTGAPAKLRRTKKSSATPPASEPRSPEPSTLQPGTFGRVLRRPKRGMGAGSAGQSGDLQGLASQPDTDSESVQELAAEGQAFEAEVVSAIGEAKDPDEGELHTHEVPVNDVPKEYLDEE